MDVLHFADKIYKKEFDKFMLIGSKMTFDKKTNINYPNLYVKRFSIENIKKIINIFGFKKILDINAEWGDRLIGAINCDVDVYFGISPNIKMFPIYNQIIQTLNGKTKCLMLNDKFENTIIPKLNFDMLFASMSYFVDENDEDNNDNNDNIKYIISETKNFNIYFETFVKPTLKNGIKYLKDGAIIIIDTTTFIIGLGKTKEFMKQLFIDYLELLNVKITDVPNEFIEDNFLFFKKNNPISNSVSSTTLMSREDKSFFIEKINDNMIIDNYNNKVNLLDITNYPLFQIQEIKHQNKLFNIVRDDLIIGGFYTRMYYEFVKNINHKNVGITLTKTLKMMITEIYSFLKFDKIIHIYAYYNGKTLRKIRDLFLPVLNNKCMSYIIHFHILLDKDIFKTYKNLGEIYEKNDINKLIKKYNKKNNLNNILIIDDIKLNKLKKKAFRKNLKYSISPNLKITDLWVIHDPLYFYKYLKKKFKCKLHVVVFGPIQHIEEDKNIKYYFSDDNMYVEENIDSINYKFPNYSMNKQTEIRMWKFINKFGKSGDYVFNYFGDVNQLIDNIITNLVLI
jgi:hypothetical protein